MTIKRLLKRFRDKDIFKKYISSVETKNTWFDKLK